MFRLSRAPLAVVAVILLSALSETGGLIRRAPAAHPLTVAAATTPTQTATTGGTPPPPEAAQPSEDPPGPTPSPTPSPESSSPAANTATAQVAGAGASAWGHPLWPRPPSTAWPIQPVGGVTAIGDSVMVDATPNLRAVLPGISIDAVAGRQVFDGLAAMETLAGAGQLRANIVIALGTNGMFTSTQFNRLLALAAGRPVVVLTNYCPYCDWVPQNNDMMKASCTPARNCTVADWHALALDNRAWFNPDGVHMPIGGIGGLAYAQLVARSLEPRAEPPCPPTTPARAAANAASGRLCWGPGNQ